MASFCASPVKSPRRLGSRRSPWLAWTPFTAWRSGCRTGSGGAGATLNLKAQGDAKNVKEDIAKDKTVATITWTFAAGNAAGGISVDDSWEGNHEMGID